MQSKITASRLVLWDVVNMAICPLHSENLGGGQADEKLLMEIRLLAVEIYVAHVKACQWIERSEFVNANAESKENHLRPS